MADPIGWHLGLTSEHYESGGLGPGTISSGVGDPGGISYGSYQLSTNAGTLQEYIAQSPYKDQFKGLEPTTPAFDTKWKELATTDPGFGQDQHNFIKTTHYEAQISTLKDDGIDLTDRGPAVQDALWSTSVQLKKLTPQIFEKGLQEKFGKDYKLSDLSDKDIVGAVQDYKIAHNDRLFRSSPPKERQNLLARAESEKADLLSLADGKVAEHRAHAHHASHHAANGALRLGDHGAAVTTLQTDLGALGYSGAHGKPMVADGHFGPGTKAAVAAFQSDNNMTVDGTAGPKTLEAIHERRQLQLAVPDFGASALPNLSPSFNQHLTANDLLASSKQAATATPSRDPRDPGNPDHAMNQSVRDQVRGLYAGQGVSLNDQQLDRTTAAVMADARRSGLNEITSLRFSEDYATGKPNANGNIFAFQGDDPARAGANWSQTNAQQAAATPPEASYQQFAQYTQQLNLANSQFQAQQTRANAQEQIMGPGSGGPNMGGPGLGHP